MALGFAQDLQIFWVSNQKMLGFFSYTAVFLA